MDFLFLSSVQLNFTISERKKMNILEKLILKVDLGNKK
jgi:hypothetical protein